MNKSLERDITKIADLEAEESILLDLILESKDSEKSSLYKKDLKSTRLRLTKLRNKIKGKNDKVEFIDKDIYTDNILSLEFAMKVKSMLNIKPMVTVECSSLIDDYTLSLLRQSIDVEITKIDSYNLEIRKFVNNE